MLIALLLVTVACTRACRVAAARRTSSRDQQALRDKQGRLDRRAQRDLQDLPDRPDLLGLRAPPALVGRLDLAGLSPAGRDRGAICIRLL